MIKKLIINNYALIEELNISPSQNFNVITGETGAGKSIMLGALGLLLGNRADKKVLYFEDKKCIVEATFDISNYQLQSIFEEEEIEFDDETIIRREISPSGKSRAFVNDQPVTLDILKRISPKLIDIHSQHDTLLLRDFIFQLQLVDEYAGNADVRELVANQFTDYVTSKRNFESLQQKASSLKKEYDYNKFQLDELVKAEIKDVEEVEYLESELQILERSEEVKSCFSTSIGLLEEQD